MKHLLEVHNAPVNGRVPTANRNVDGTGNGETCIHGALIMGHYEIVKKLILDHNAGVNEAYDEDDSEYRGETALHIACAAAPMDMVKVYIFSLLFVG
jgi:hypothetical protein